MRRGFEDRSPGPSTIPIRSLAKSKKERRLDGFYSLRLISRDSLIKLELLIPRLRASDLSLCAKNDGVFREIMSVLEEARLMVSTSCSHRITRPLPGQRLARRLG